MMVLNNPWWMLTAVMIVPSAWLGWRWMSGVPMGRRLCAIIVRCVLIVLVALALSDLQRVRETDRVAVVALLDVSGSVRSFMDFGVDDLGSRASAEDAYRDFLLRASAGQQTEDALGVLVFDGRVSAIGLPSRSGVLERLEPVQSSPGTDLGSAIARGRAMLPPEMNGRLILISDGRTTSGPLASIEGTTPIDVVPLRYEVRAEVVVESVELPARALPESGVDARVVLRSAGESRGELRLFYDGVAIDLDENGPGIGVRVQLEPGRQIIDVPITLGSGRVHRVRAQYIPDARVDEIGRSIPVGDTSDENNEAGGITITPGHGRVLIVDGLANATSNADGDLLPEILERGDWDVERVAAPAFPADLLELEQYDLVILVNTPRDGFEENDETLIETYTSVLGGGLIMVGGPDALGAGGWRGSKLESILPVKLDVADDVVTPDAAVVLVLDSSGSMRRAVFGSSRSQQTVANESAAGALDVLDPNDLIGVIAFSSTPRIIVPIGPNTDPDTTRQAVLRIRSDGGTSLVPAMELAREQLDSVDAKVKHVIVLSDGQSENAEMLPGIAQQFGDAGIKVTTIAVGDDADASTLRQMATRSGGISHRVVNPTRLPRVFLKAIRIVRSPMIRNERFSPVVLDPNTPMTGGGLSSLPTLGGLVMTERVDDPLVSTPIVSDQGEPVLAFHQVELGRVAVFTSDASAWASRWIEQPVFEQFWLALARWTMRSVNEEPGELSTIVQQGDAEIIYNAIDPEGAPLDGLDVDARVFAPDGSSRTIPLTQIGAGRYTGAARGLGSGVHVVIARPRTGGENDEAIMPTIAGIEIASGEEYAHLNSDPQSLIDLAARTGGRVLDFDNPEGSPLFDRLGLTPNRAYLPVLPTLLPMILIVFLIDIASRRVAWDRWVSQARDETIAVTRAVRTNTDRLRSTKRVPQTESTIEIDQPSRRAHEVTQRTRSPEPASPPTPDEEGADASNDNPLLAAKRRARSRMDEES